MLLTFCAYLWRVKVGCRHFTIVLHDAEIVYLLHKGEEEKSEVADSSA